MLVGLHCRLWKVLSIVGMILDVNEISKNVVCTPSNDSDQPGAF